MNINAPANPIMRSRARDGFFQCPFCPCLFFSQYNLDCHLEAFGRKEHLRLWRCSHILLAEDGHVAGVDGHGDWFWSNKRFHRPIVVKNCRVLMRARF